MSIAIFGGRGVQESPLLVWKAQSGLDRAAGLTLGESAAIRRVLDLVKHVAGTDSTVRLLGQTGTGTEVIAGHVHALSARRERWMVRVNCSAIPATLLESELFGREYGWPGETRIAKLGLNRPQRV
jgi:transcriptional regulator with GAF, ATPase, and Fis domain